ncbi:MAG TPA: APC family permease [Candidatus Acidoferrales bacterium]|nr:APC family permease [Candidatus Acidoferrales bacterium]
MSTAAEGILGSAPRPAPRSRRHSPRIAAHGKLTVLTLAAATYFMVSGGPYGLEDIVKMAGYAGAIAILLITPLLWSVPTAMMVSELSSSIPEEGGFYIWVRRGLGNFWGYQETWLSLAGSIFEMALYPTLFVDYLGHFAPALTAGHRAIIIELGLILICTLWNLWGTRAVGEGSVWMSLALLSPFVVLVAVALSRHVASNATLLLPARAGLTAAAGHVTSNIMPAAAVPAHAIGHVDILGGILIAMWNYMGWDNTSTIAEEVERPQRTFPLVMLLTVSFITVSYIVPVAAAAHAGISPLGWSTGGWVDIGRAIGGQWLSVAIAAGGAIGAIGTFNALTLSFSRLPLVMAQDGYLPKIFAHTSARTGMPWVAITACSIGWAACLFLNFERLVIIDVLVTGLSVLLEFWALIGLRIREPNLARPYRVPGGMLGVILIGIPPLALMVAAVVRNRTEAIGATSSLAVALALIALGPIFYLISRPRAKAAAREQSSVPNGN